MAAVTRDHQHAGAGGLDLFHFAPAVKNAFVVVPVGQGPAPTPATELVHALWIEIHPMGQALIHDPARFFEKTVAESFLRAPAVVAGVMVSGQIRNTGAVQADATLSDIADQQIENGDGFKLLERFGVPFLQTKPGRQIGVPSFGPQQRAGL